MAVISKGGTLPDTGVTKAEVYAMVDNATVSAIVDADIASNAAIVDTKLDTIATAGKVNISALVASSQAAGDIIYFTTVWTRLPVGTAGQVLTVNGAATAPEWA